jgi:hypothetical protein
MKKGRSRNAAALYKPDWLAPRFLLVLLRTLQHIAYTRAGDDILGIGRVSLDLSP